MNSLIDKKKKFDREATPNNTIDLCVSSVQQSYATDIKVQKIEIEKFNGKNPRKWPQFKAMFEDCFHNNPRYSNSAKFQYLRAHLEVDSEAYNTIAGLQPTDEHYDAAWKLLCEAYDNDRKIVNDIVLSFIDATSVDSPSRSALIGLKNIANNLIQSLPKYGINVESWDPILVPILMRKMDGESIRLWTLERP